MEELKEGWRRVKISEVCEIIFSGGTPNTKISEYWNGNINWLSSGETRHRYIKTTDKKITKNGVENSSTKLALKNDVVVASAGQGFTRGQASYCLINTYINQSVISLRSNFKVIDSKYLFFNIISRYNELRHLSDGNASRGSLTTKIMKDLDIFLPPLETQEKIASILSALDDKIEINNEMNKTLEEMAQTLFKRWFIDFDFPNENGEPYRSSGGKMVDSELGEIPEGWRIGSLEEIVNISSGKRPKVKKDKDKLYKIPIIGANGIMSYTNEFMYNEKLLTIGRVGTLGVVQKYYDKIWPSDNSLVIKSNYLEMIYFILKNVDYKSLNRGSTQPLITQTDMKNLKIIIGETELILEFCKTIFKLFDFQRKNQQEINSLTEIRDILLPKLMSGEIEV